MKDAENLKLVTKADKENLQKNNKSFLRKKILLFSFALTFFVLIVGGFAFAHKKKYNDQRTMNSSSACIGLLFCSFMEDEAAFFAQNDKDNDELLSREEFLAAHQSRFQTIDQTQDKLLSRSELEQAITQLREQWEEKENKGGNYRRQWKQHSAKTMSRNLIIWFDEDEDTKISLEETEAPLLDLFYRLDRNEDDQLSRLEVERAKNVYARLRGEKRGYYKRYEKRGYGREGDYDDDDQHRKARRNKRDYY